MAGPRRALLILAFVAAAVVASCGSPHDARPNVILISVDTLRADHLGSYGYGRDTSPFIDSLAANGVRFANTFSPSSWTLPAHMSLVTSAYPHTHGVQGIKAALGDGVPTLAESLEAGGYRTSGFVSWIFLSAKYGFARGFDEYQELVPPRHLRGPGSHHVIKAGPFVDRVLEWVDREHRQPYFLFLHLFDPHMSYEPPVEYARRFDPTIEDTTEGHYESLMPYIRGLGAESLPVPPARLRRALDLYDGEIAYTDSQLERLFAALEQRKLLDNTLIVFTSDHGEEFNEHGSMEGHGWTLYDEVLRVPLTIVLPGRDHRGRTVERQVGTIDVAPTILDLVGLAAPDAFEGRSLAPLIAGEAEAGREELTFGQIRRFNARWSLRTPRHKLIYTQDTGVNLFGVPVQAGYELYDLLQDPAESNNLFDRRGPETDPLLERMQSFVERQSTGEPGETQLTPEELERLRSLGYVGN